MSKYKEIIQFFFILHYSHRQTDFCLALAGWEIWHAGHTKALILISLSCDVVSTPVLHISDC